MLDEAARSVGHAVQRAPCDEPTLGSVPARTHQSEQCVDATPGSAPARGQRSTEAEAR
jgi:hypothetical protein